ncbi:GNAT family N-acetyltransferase [Paenibacillus tianmuensis]|uniref:GNAT family N-acetyltransferase n=1 Tax=Paenibacillus tianmuensis TaxID=624147 RepID=UPI001431F73D|nr:GNAT family N-acetyltransferase [Paenibacillus tianmuensis]
MNLSSDGSFQTVNLRSQEWRNQDFLNREFVYAHIDQFWETQEDFYNKGYGYAAIEGSTIIGVCYSSFVTKETHAIGIETLPQHHKRGVGACLASLVVKDIAQSGFSSYWDCSQSNEASNKLALRLGFQQVHQYKCVGFAL